MGFIPVANVAKIEVLVTSNGEQCVNVYHAIFDGLIDATNIADLAAAVSSWWLGSMQPFLPHSVEGISVTVTDLTTSGSFQTVDPGIANEVGAGTGRPLPNNATFCIKWTTGLSGRSARGRTYHIGLTEEQLDTNPNLVDGTAAAAIIDAYEDLLSAVAGVTHWALAVVSYFHNGAPRTNGLATPIDNVGFADLRVDSQRRRLAGRGA